MNIKELSVNNYVQKPGAVSVPINIANILRPNDIWVGQVLRISDNGTPVSEKSLELVNVKDLRPITITPELLKKIGFDHDSVRLKFTRLIKDIEIEVVSYSKGWILYVLYPDGEYCRMLIKYIHQLQNFLTLCGIELDIKL